MKKIKLIISIVCLLGLLTLNFSIPTHNSMNNDLSLENVKALQAAAGEMWCDGTTQDDCTIVQGSQTGLGKGILRSQD